MSQVDASLTIKDRLQKAENSSFIVVAIDKTYSLMNIREKRNDLLIIEEVMIPAAKWKLYQKELHTWKNWIERDAPGNTSWVVYAIRLSTGKIESYYSYTKKSWCKLTKGNDFISNLISLNMAKIPKSEMKKVGPPPRDKIHDFIKTWRPKLIFEGRSIDGIEFEAWKARWPNDSSELAGKVVLVYFPVEEVNYPSYFPYWLEVHGLLGKAKVRIVDSGKGLNSPRPLPY